jgi:hypothetical protein
MTGKFSTVGTPEWAAFNLLVDSYPAPCRAKRLGGEWAGAALSAAFLVAWFDCKCRTRVGMNIGRQKISWLAKETQSSQSQAALRRFMK